MFLPHVILTFGALAILDIFNPTAMSVTAYHLSSEKPKTRAGIFILGFFLAYCFCGLAIYFGFNHVLAFAWMIIERHKHLAEVVVGVAFVITGMMLNRQSKLISFGEHASRPRFILSTGALLALIQIPYSLPYIALIAYLHKMKYSFAWEVVTVALYSLIFILGPIAIYIAYIIFGKRFIPFLSRMKNWIDRNSHPIAKVVLLLGGAFLIGLGLAGYIPIWLGWWKL